MAGEIGPIQLYVIDFERPEFKGRIAEELEALRVSGVVRIVDWESAGRQAAAWDLAWFDDDLVASYVEARAPSPAPNAPWPQNRDRRSPTIAGAPGQRSRRRGRGSRDRPGPGTVLRSSPRNR